MYEPDGWARHHMADRFGVRIEHCTLVLGALFLLGCKTIDDSWAIPPFVEIYPTPSSVGSTHGTELVIRPLVGLERLQGDDLELRDTGFRARTLPPFLAFHWSRDEVRHWILPVAYYRKFTTPKGGADVDWIFLPLIGGDSQDEGIYFGLFPLGGRLKGLFGRDTIDFALFPLYLLAVDGQRSSMHVLWPFANAVWGGGWSGWRVWPIWGSYQSESSVAGLRMDSHFVLWPLATWQSSQQAIDNTTLVFLFPFYGIRENSRIVTQTVLWPFIQYSYDKQYGRGSWFGFIWPFRFEEGQGDVWPLFGLKRKENGWLVHGVYYRRFREYALWPLQRYEWSTDGIQESTRLWVAPILWHFHSIDKSTLREHTEWLLWPLLRYVDDGETVSFDSIYPIPYRRIDFYRYYSRLFSVIRVRSCQESLGVEVLYGAITYQSDVTSQSFEVSILGGVLGFGAKESGASFRFLFIPWW